MLASIIPSHEIASWLLVHIKKVLDKIGLGENESIEQVVYFVIITALCFLIGWLITKGIMAITNKAVQVRNSALSRQLLHERTLAKCSHIIPPLIFMGLVPVAFNSHSELLHIIFKLAAVYTFVAFAIGLNAVLTFIFNRYNERENTRNLPIKGILNVAKGIVWIIIAIVSVSVLIDKSPGTLLAGLGAFAAALLLIFKNSILGFVAGIQMSQNDMLRVGDWIVVPSTIANGIVIDVSLSVVKVRNWDNTIVMVPPFTLVSTSYQNWRGMKESGVRQIARAYAIDITTVKDIDNDFLEQIVKSVPDVKPFVDRLQADKKSVNCGTGSRPVNGTIETNLGLYRAYLCQYLINNPYISKEQQILVRTMTPEEYGIPLQVWCFTATTDWNSYEGIQSALFEHIAASLPLFGLAVYAAGSEDVSVSGQLPVTVTSTGEVAPRAISTPSPAQATRPEKSPNASRNVVSDATNAQK